MVRWMVVGSEINSDVLWTSWTSRLKIFVLKLQVGSRPPSTVVEHYNTGILTSGISFNNIAQQVIMDKRQTTLVTESIMVTRRLAITTASYTPTTPCAYYQQSCKFLLSLSLIKQLSLVHYL